LPPRETIEDPVERERGLQVAHDVNMIESRRLRSQCHVLAAVAHDSALQAKAEDSTAGSWPPCRAPSSDSDMLRTQASATAAATRGMLARRAKSRPLPSSRRLPCAKRRTRGRPDPRDRGCASEVRLPLACRPAPATRRDRR
jgi:hypothetical protein